MQIKTVKLAQLFFRLAIAFSFLSAVADRLGFWGAPGSPSVSWGNWQNFVSYANKLNAFASPQIGELLAFAATFLEVLFALLLIIGYKLKLTALASAALLLAFALSMTFSIGIKAPFDYSVWTSATACLLLYTISSYPYSLDAYLAKGK
ncbi:DoxX family membrane protein [Pedobacter sp. Hv1]|uniref:DoxX family membrane protein n=1 Tax=Pedobacter sp. Hv1 TaxID=1740090 RepID=UPI0006D8972C|nr:DoxX family membrane protein [Pedobacter sp. Hv1]KQC00483.1 DoxX family protein [Pedobacter sp. Hv1]